MTISKEGTRLLLNGLPTTRAEVKKVCKKNFSAGSWERLWADVEKYGRVHVAIVFTDSRKGRLQ